MIQQLEQREPDELAEDNDEHMEDDEDDESEEGYLSGSDSQGSDVEDTDEEVVDIELRNRIGEALQVNGIGAADASDDEEEELLDDEQMMAIDAQLAQVFLSRSKEKKSGKSKFFLVHNTLITHASRRCGCSTRSHTFQEPRAGSVGRFH